MKVMLRAGVTAGILTFLLAQSVLAWPDDARPQLSSGPAGTVAGQTWDVDVSFTSGGALLAVTTLRPVVIIRNEATGQEASFKASPTARAGYYHASVLFPSGGSWTYAIREANGGITFPFQAVDIAAPVLPSTQPAPAAAPNLLAPLAALLLIAAATSTLLASRRRRQMAASAR